MWLRLALHNNLDGRDAADAHPTSAITGLDTALANTKNQGVKVKYIPASQMEVSATGGATKSKTAVGAMTLEVLQFSDAVTTKAYFSVVLPKSWDAGNVSLSFIWNVGTTAAGNISMRHAYMPVADGDTLGLSLGGAATALLPAPGAIDTINMSGFSESFKAAGYSNTKAGLLAFLMYREGAVSGDTFPNAMYLLGVELQYTDNAATDA